MRATGRRREIAIRAAIGGSRGRIIRQLLTESVVLSLAGGAARPARRLGRHPRACSRSTPPGLPRVGEDGALVGLDWRVVAFTLRVSLATGILFGLIPALQSSKTDLTTTLKESGGRSGTGFRQNKARSILVVVEVALALVLLVGSALLIRTAMALGRVDPGFDTHNVLTMRMSLKGAQYEKAEAVEQVGAQRRREAASRFPASSNASATCCVPLQGGYGLPFRIVGRPLAADSQGPYPRRRRLDDGVARLLRGLQDPGAARPHVQRARHGTSPPVVIINEAMAKQFWPKGDPLTDRLVIGKGVMREFASRRRARRSSASSPTSGATGSTAIRSRRCSMPQAQVPDAANALNVGLTPISWIVRTQSAAAVAEQRRSRSSCARSTGLPVIRRRVDGRDRLDLDVAPAASTCG